LKQTTRFLENFHGLFYRHPICVLRTPEFEVASKVLKSLSWSSKESVLMLAFFSLIKSDLLAENTP
jgi:hypothetical protein